MCCVTGSFLSCSKNSCAKALVKFAVEFTVIFGYTIGERGLFPVTNIVPISDLKNYSEVLSNCDNGSVVYLTKNGRGKYVVQSMLEYEKMKATVQLLADLSKGIESLRTEGGLTIDEAFEGLEE